MADNLLAPLSCEQHYETIRTLGKGACGLVVLAKDVKTGKEVAIKFVERRHVARNQKNVRREIVNHSLLMHPHIIQFQRCVVTEEHLGIVMELANGGNLFDLVRERDGLSEKDARWFFKQLMLALDYCHKIGVSSRDVKLENALLENAPGRRRPMLKLCDFGLSINEGQSTPRSMEIGTPGYCAPELLRMGGGQPPHNYDSKKADNSTESLMKARFDDPQDLALGEKTAQMRARKRAVQGQFTFPLHVPLSDGVRDLLSKMIEVDPVKRASIADIQAHPWFKEDHPANLDLNQVNAAYLELSSARATPEYAERSQTVIEAIIKAVAEQGPHGAVAAPVTDEQLVDAQLVGVVPFPKSPWLSSQPLPGPNAAPTPDVQLLGMEPLANVPRFARQQPPAAAAASCAAPEPMAPDEQDRANATRHWALAKRYATMVNDTRARGALPARKRLHRTGSPEAGADETRGCPKDAPRLVVNRTDSTASLATPAVRQRLAAASKGG